MSEVFISHVEEDSAVALQLTEGLEGAGYLTWCYERDSVPGVSYLIQTGRAIDDCQAVILVVSPASVSSHQVSREVERAHECGKPFMPVMLDISYEEFKTQQPMWRQAIGTHTAVDIPEGGVPAILPWIVKGLQGMGIHPTDKATQIRREAERLKEESQKTERILQFLGGRVGVEGNRVFVFGFKPSIKGIYGRDALADECVQHIASGQSEFLCLYGSGGIGKSTLAALVFSRFAEEGLGNFDRYIWYHLGENPEPETVLLELVTIATDGSVPTAGPEKPAFEMLLDLLRMRLANRPTLVVLDNLDSTFDLSAEAGTFADDRWPQLFRAFLGGRSAVIVGSRQVPRFQDPAAEFRRVDGIAQSEAINLMREAGLKDDDKVLKEAYELLQGHPMALSAMAAAIMRRPSYGARLARAGDIMDSVRRCPDISRNPVVLFEKVIHPDRLPDVEYALITSMPALFRAETAEAIGALRPEIASEDVAAALDELCLRSLVQMVTDVHPPLYSLHLLVREVAASRTENPQLLHERSYEYYISLPWDRKTKNPNEVEHLRLAAFHALAIKDLERAKAILYNDPRLAELLEGWGRFDLALPLHRQELDVAREVGEERDRMFAAGLVSKCFTRLGNCPEALVHAEEALKIAVACDDMVGEGTYRGQIGRVHYHTGDFDKSQRWLEEALELTIESGDRRREGLARGLIGQIMSKRGDFENALEWLGTAHRIAVQIGDQTSEVECSASIGQIHFLRSEFDRATEILIPALNIAIENGDRISESRLSTLIGQINMGRGDFDQAARQFEQALKVDAEIGNRRHEGALQTLIAKMHNCRGEYDKALELLEKSLNIAIEIGSRAAEAYRRGHIGDVYLGMGEPDKALEYFQSALSFTIQSGNKTNECVWRGKIGEVHLSRGDYDAALEWLNRALDISVEMKDKEDENEWRGRIGQVYLERCEYEEARDWLESALRLALEIDDPINERTHRMSLGKLHMALDEPCDAAEHFKKVREIAKKLGMVERFMIEAELDFGKAQAECEKG